jgi:hypothetical protein
MGDGIRKSRATAKEFAENGAIARDRDAGGEQSSRQHKKFEYLTLDA